MKGYQPIIDSLESIKDLLVDEKLEKKGKIDRWDIISIRALMVLKVNDFIKENEVKIIKEVLKNKYFK